MKRWESLVDRLVRDIIGDGNISHLNGAGQPLDLDDDPNTPEHLRIAHKIMRDYDVTPDWMATAKALEQIEAKLRKQINIRADRFQREQTSALRRGSYTQLTQIEADWQAYTEAFAEKIGRYNKEVLLYNLKVPKGIQHKQVLISEKLIEQALSRRGDD